MKKLTLAVLIVLTINGCTGGYNPRYLNEPMGSFTYSRPQATSYTSFNHGNGVTSYKPSNIGY